MLVECEERCHVPTSADVDDEQMTTCTSEKAPINGKGWL